MIFVAGIMIFVALVAGICVGVLIERSQTAKHYNLVPKKTYKL